MSAYQKRKQLAHPKKMMSTYLEIDMSTYLPKIIINQSLSMLLQKKTSKKLLKDQVLTNKDVNINKTKSSSQNIIQQNP